jgi:hypothetical protein
LIFLPYNKKQLFSLTAKAPQNMERVGLRRFDLDPNSLAAEIVHAVSTHSTVGEAAHSLLFFALIVSGVCGLKTVEVLNADVRIRNHFRPSRSIHVFIHTSMKRAFLHPGLW